MIHIPEQWDTWSIIEKVGEGSFGSVYKAVSHDRTAAIKIIKIPKDRESYQAIKNSVNGNDLSVESYCLDMVLDIRKIYEVMDQLKNHPNIVTVYDYIVEANTDMVGYTIYILMEYLESFPYYASCHDLKEHDIIQLGIDLCNALELCEKEHIVHRDIKPDNILVSKDQVFKLCDFGIAKRFEKTNASVGIHGTFSYMAPEVHHGRPYNHTADIYSLGLVLYILMNNNRDPYVNMNKQIIFYKDKEDAFLKRIEGKEEIPAPINASEGLQNIILKAISYEPKNRYQTAKEFRHDLEKLQNGTYRGKKNQTSRHSYGKKLRKTILTVATLVVVALAVRGGIWSWNHFMVKPINHVRVEDPTNLCNMYCTLDGNGTLTLEGTFAKNVSAVPDISVYPWDNYRSKIRRIIFPNENLMIPEGAFKNCKNLKEVSINDKVSDIEDSAFENCSHLKKVTLPKNLESVGNSAFFKTPWLKSHDKFIKNPSGDMLIAYLGDDTEVTIPKEIQTISSSAFEGRTRLKKVTLNHISTIQSKAFNGCTALAEITLSKHLYIVGDEAFSGCSNLQTINLPIPYDSVLWGYDVFHGTEWADYHRVGDYLIDRNSILKYYGKEPEITIPDGISYIAGSSFARDDTLEKISIPDSVKDIGCQAFSNCENLKEVNIKGHNTYLGEKSFNSCPKLYRKNFHIPGDNHEIGYAAVDFTDSQSPDYQTLNNVLIFWGDMAEKDVVIPDGIQYISDTCFVGSEMEILKIPTSVVKISDDTFYDMKDLKTVIFESGSKCLIGKGAFQDCHKLEKVVLPKRNFNKQELYDIFAGSPWYKNR